MSTSGVVRQLKNELFIKRATLRAKPQKLLTAKMGEK
jgi:hypothetical protein